METISVVDLGEKFSRGTPSIEEQNDFLATRCADDAIAYLGDEENLYQSTLQPYWGTISETSWNGGTRSVNCSLIHAGKDSDSFSEIVGTATDGRDGLTINGKAPEKQPERNPLRGSEENNTPSPSTPAAPEPESAPAQ